MTKHKDQPAISVEQMITQLARHSFENSRDKFNIGNDYKGRQIDRNLRQRLTCGDLSPLLNHVKGDECLSLEIRQKGYAIVYYKKCKILELRPRSFYFDEKYLDYEGCTIQPFDAGEAAVNPIEYFAKAKYAINGWLEKHAKNEFEIQQRIARDNRSADGRYLIFDMEYQFAQDSISKGQRIKSGCYDLVGLECNTNRIVFFEVKRGLGALQNKSGIGAHIKDFRRVLYGEGETKEHNLIQPTTTARFRDQLYSDAINIISDKIALGLWNTHPGLNATAIDANDVELKFVYCFDKKANAEEKARYLEAYKKETEGMEDIYETIFIDPSDRKAVLL